jgi:hypothetical protein
MAAVAAPDPSSFVSIAVLKGSVSRGDKIEV